MEPTEQAEAAWDHEIRELADRTLYPRTDSWYTGANIPGKPRQFLAHVRGSKYFDRVTEIAEGGFEGFVLGGAVGLGYALSTPTAQGGMAAPRGAARLLAAAASGACCALAAVALSQTGSYLGAMSLDLMAQSFPGSQVGLGPLARLLGEAEPGDPLDERR